MSEASVLSDYVTNEIEHWKSRFPEGKERSAVIAALHAVQHENKGYLTIESMDAVAVYELARRGDDDDRKMRLVGLEYRARLLLDRLKKTGLN